MVARNLYAKITGSTTPETLGVWSTRPHALPLHTHPSISLYPYYIYTSYLGESGTSPDQGKPA